MLFREVEHKDEGRGGRIGSYGSSPPIRHIYDSTHGGWGGRSTLTFDLISRASHKNY